MKKSKRGRRRRKKGAFTARALLVLDGCCREKKQRGETVETDNTASGSSSLLKLPHKASAFNCSTHYVTCNIGALISEDEEVLAVVQCVPLSDYTVGGSSLTIKYSVRTLLHWPALD